MRNRNSVHDARVIYERLLNDFRHPPTMTVTDFNGRVHVYPYKGYTAMELAYHLDWGNSAKARSRVTSAMPRAAEIAKQNDYYIPCGSRRRRYFLTNAVDEIRRDGDYCAHQEATWGSKKAVHYQWADEHETQSIPAESDA